MVGYPPPPAAILPGATLVAICALSVFALTSAEGAADSTSGLYPQESHTSSLRDSTNHKNINSTIDILIHTNSVERFNTTDDNQTHNNKKDVVSVSNKIYSNEQSHVSDSSSNEMGSREYRSSSARKGKSVTWGQVLSNSPATFYDPRQPILSPSYLTANTRSSHLQTRHQNYRHNVYNDNHYENEAQPISPYSVADITDSYVDSHQQQLQMKKEEEDEVIVELAKYLMGHKDEAWIPVQSSNPVEKAEYNDNTFEQSTQDFGHFNHLPHRAMNSANPETNNPWLQQRNPYSEYDKSSTQKTTPYSESSKAISPYTKKVTIRQWQTTDTPHPVQDQSSHNYGTANLAAENKYKKPAPKLKYPSLDLRNQYKNAPSQRVYQKIASPQIYLKSTSELSYKNSGFQQIHPNSATQEPHLKSTSHQKRYSYSEPLHYSTNSAPQQEHVTSAPHIVYRMDSPSQYGEVSVQNQNNGYFPLQLDYEGKSQPKSRNGFLHNERNNQVKTLPRHRVTISYVTEAPSHQKNENKIKHYIEDKESESLLSTERGKSPNYGILRNSKPMVGNHTLSSLQNILEGLKEIARNLPEVTTKSSSKETEHHIHKNKVSDTVVSNTEPSISRSVQNSFNYDHMLLNNAGHKRNLVDQDEIGQNTISIKKYKLDSINRLNLRGYGNSHVTMPATTERYSKKENTNKYVHHTNLNNIFSDHSYDQPTIFTSKPIFTTDAGEDLSNLNELPITTTSKPFINLNQRLTKTSFIILGRNITGHHKSLHSKLLLYKIIQRLRNKTKNEYHESFFENDDYEYVETSDPNFNISLLTEYEDDESLKEIKHKAQRRTLDLLYHMFIDPTTDEDGNRRNTLIEDLIRAFDEHVVGDIQAYRKHKQSGKKGQSHFRENNGDFFTTLMESVGLDQEFMQSTADLFTEANEQTPPASKAHASTNNRQRSNEGRKRPQRNNKQQNRDPQIRALESGNEFVLTDENGKHRIISIDEIIKTLSSLSEDEALDLLFGPDSQLRRSVDESEAKINSHASEMRKTIEAKPKLPQINSDHHFDNHGGNSIKVNDLIVLNSRGKTESFPINSVIDPSNMNPQQIYKAATSSPTALASQFLLEKEPNNFSQPNFKRPTNPTLNAAHLLFGLTPAPFYESSSTTTTTPRPVYSTTSALPLLLVKFGNQYVPVDKHTLENMKSKPQNPLTVSNSKPSVINDGKSVYGSPFGLQKNKQSETSEIQDNQKYIQEFYNVLSNLKNANIHQNDGLESTTKASRNREMPQKDTVRYINSNSNLRNPSFKSFQNSKTKNTGNEELRKHLESLVDIHKTLTPESDSGLPVKSPSITRKPAQKSHSDSHHTTNRYPSNVFGNQKNPIQTNHGGSNKFNLPPPLTTYNPQDQIINHNAHDQQRHSSIQSNSQSPNKERLNKLFNEALNKMRQQPIRTSPTVQPTTTTTTESPYVMALRAIQRSSTKDTKKNVNLYQFVSPTYPNQNQNENWSDSRMSSTRYSNSRNRQTNDRIPYYGDEYHNLNRRRDTIGRTTSDFQSIDKFKKLKNMDIYEDDRVDSAYQRNFQRIPNTQHPDLRYMSSNDRYDHQISSNFERDSTFDASNYYRRDPIENHRHMTPGFVQKSTENTKTQNSNGIVSNIFNSLKEALPKPIHYRKPTPEPKHDQSSSFFGFNLPNIFSSGHSHSHHHNHEQEETKIDRSDVSDELKWDDPLGILGIYDYLPFTKRRTGRGKLRREPVIQATTARPLTKGERLKNALKAGNVPDRVSQILVKQIQDKSKSKIPGVTNIGSTFDRSNTAINSHARADRRSSYHPHPSYHSQEFGTLYRQPETSSHYGIPPSGHSPSYPPPGFSSEYGSQINYQEPYHYSGASHTVPDSDYDTYIVPIGHKKEVNRAQPAFDLSFLFNSVQVLKTGEKDGSFTLPTIGDPKRFVDIHRPPVAK